MTTEFVARTDVVNVVRDPLYGYNPSSTYMGPIGQADIIESTRRLITDNKLIADAIFWEYVDIISCLKHMEVPFVVAEGPMHPEMGEFRDRLAKSGVEQALFPEPYWKALGFPRDMCVRLPGMTLVSGLEADLDAVKIFQEEQEFVDECNLAQGGRVLNRRDVVLAFRTMYGDPVAEGETNIKVRPAETSIFEEWGARVGLFPNTACLVYDGVDSGEKKKAFIDNHIDRTAGLLEDGDGNLHMVIDPKVVAWKDFERGQFLQNRETIAEYRRVCDSLGVILHVPKSMAIPMSTGFVQFQDGRVLMTCGDDDVAEVVEGIVGSENLFQTTIPIKYFPARLEAGLRCLIGELPPWMLRIEQYIIVK